MNTLILTPAYGRDYESKEAAIKDWNLDKDFVIANFSMGSRKINKSDFINFRDSKELKGVTNINFRYSKLTKVAVLNVKEI